MNNQRLQTYCDTFYTDEGDKVEKRCLILFAGTDLERGKALNIDIIFIQNDLPNKQKFAQVDFKIDNFTVEQCSDIILSLTEIVPDFAIMFHYDDLYPKPADIDLHRKASHQASLYYLRN